MHRQKTPFRVKSIEYGKKSQTTDQLERSGTLRDHPGRYKHRAAEPVCKDPLGPPPRDFAVSAELFACWTEVLEATKEVKLTSADRLHVEMTARLVWKCRQPGAKAADYAELVRHFGKFGLTQVDRSKVVGVGQKTEQEDFDEWAELAAGACPGMRKN